MYSVLNAILDSLHQGTLCTLIAVVESLHIINVKFKAKDVGVTLDATRRVALGKRAPLLLQCVSHQNLANVFVVLLGNRH